MTARRAHAVRGVSTTASTDGVSVVVPTFNRRELLAATLDCLCSQDLERELFEVIVVDDGSTDGSRAVVEAVSSRIQTSYFFQEDRGFRVAAARNVGIDHARFRTTLFLDSGILVSSRLLRMHYIAHAGEAALAVLGLSYGVQEHSEGIVGIFDIALERGVDGALKCLERRGDVRDCRESYLAKIGYDLRRMKCPWLVFWGGHVSVTTSVLRALGGFDPAFVRWGGEDVEMGLRLCEAECNIRVFATTESIHYPHPKDAVRARLDARLNATYIHEKHGLRETALLGDLGWEAIELLSRNNGAHVLG